MIQNKTLVAQLRLHCSKMLNLIYLTEVIKPHNFLKIGLYTELNEKINENLINFTAIYYF